MGKSESGVMAGIASLAGGETFRQALNILLIPLLVRIYSPAEYGEFALYSALVFLLYPLAAFRLEMAIPMTRHRRVAETLVSLSLVSGAIFSLALLPFCPFYVAVGVFGASTYQVFSSWLTREKQFHTVTKTRILQTIVQFALQLGLGLWLGGARGLIVGMVVGQYVAVAMLICQGHFHLSWVRSHYWKRLLRHYTSFFLYNFPATLVSASGSLAYPLFFGIFYPIEVVGYLGLTLRVLGLPSALIGQAVGSVFYPNYSQMASPEAARRFVERCLRQLIMVSATVFTLLGLTAPDLFSFVCGPEWVEAGHFAQILCPWFFAALITSPLLTIAMVKDQQKRHLQFNVAGALARFIALIIFGQYASIEMTLFVYGLIGILFNGSCLTWLLKRAGVSLFETTASLGHFWIFLTSALAVALALNHLFSDPLLRLSTIFSLFAFMGALFYRINNFSKGLEEQVGFRETSLF